MKPTLEALAARGGSASNEEIVEALITSMSLTEDVLNEVYPTSGAPVAIDRMSWARSYLKLPGFLASPQRGVWVLTEMGREAANWPDAQVRQACAKAYNASEALRRAAKAAKAPKPGSSGATEATEELGGETGWSDQLLATLLKMDPIAFERLCQRLLRESGFTRVEVTKAGGDGGIDGMGVLRINLVSFHVLFQCKRWQGSVGAEVVRNFRGAMQGRADKGLIITTSSFTPEARKEASRDGAPAIDLIDGDALCGLLKERGLGVTVKMVEEVTVDPAFFDTV